MVFILFSRLIVALPLISIAFAAGAQSNPEDLYGHADTSQPEYSQFDFLRGEWESAITIIAPNGDRKPLEGTSDITAFYLSDGRTMQTCFRARGFYSSDLRAFDKTNGVWRAQFINASAQRWNSFEAKVINEEIEINIPGGFSGTEDFDVKTIQHSITSNSFKVDVFRRKKEEKQWVQTYEMDYTRKPYKPSGPRC